MGTQDLAKKEDTVKISLQSPGKVFETAKALSEIQDPITKESTHNSVNCSTSALQYTADFTRKIDNITTNNSKPRNSITIKREISSEKINIKLT